MTTAICPAHSTVPGAPLRVVVSSCRCLDHLEHNEPAPRAPLALALHRANKTEADALDHLAQALCWHNYLESLMHDGPAPVSLCGTPAEADRLSAQLATAYHRLCATRNVAAARWGIAVVVEHDI